MKSQNWRFPFRAWARVYVHTRGRPPLLIVKRLFVWSTSQIRGEFNRPFLYRVALEGFLKNATRFDYRRFALHPSSPKDALVTDCRSCSRRQTRLHRRGGRPRRPCCRQRWQQGPRPRIRLAVGEPFCIMGGHAAAAAPAVPATAAAVAAAPATPGAHHHAPHPEAAAAAPHEKLELGAGRLGRVLGAAPGNA